MESRVIELQGDLIDVSNLSLRDLDEHIDGSVLAAELCGIIDHTSMEASAAFDSNLTP